MPLPLYVRTNLTKMASGAILFAPVIGASVVADTIGGRATLVISLMTFVAGLTAVIVGTTGFRGSAGFVAWVVILEALGLLTVVTTADTVNITPFTVIIGVVLGVIELTSLIVIVVVSARLQSKS